MNDGINYEEMIPKRLAELRMQKGVSARDMSLSLGQSASYINNIENGKALPKMLPFFYICEYLGITPAEFFTPEISNPKKSNELMQEINRLNARQIELLENIIREFRRTK
ncbi:MAG: helix-turn-helix transcriptional regulator [Clostridia bacterium]|nr:helix-turn-helix transcriptional regulator [Clostridia bacterium]